MKPEKFDQLAKEIIQELPEKFDTDEYKLLLVYDISDDLSIYSLNKIF